MEKGASRGPLIQLDGNCRAVVDGCDGIVDYTGERVVLRAGKLALRFEGSGLGLKRLTRDGAVIEGRITRVEYAWEGRPLGREGDR